MELVSIAFGLAKLVGLDKKIGRWIGGDNGAEVADQVISIAQQVTGGSSPEAALEQIKKDQRKLDEFKILMLGNELTLTQLAYGDRDSARAMQVAALQSDDKFSKRFIYLFSVGWSLFAFGYIGFITFGTIPEANVRFADVVLGFLLGTVLAGMFGFFYGSSSGNERRAERDELHAVLSPRR
ncbi:MAG: hypothetical protein K0U59_06575 [Gammaproteobacteria bacterium]|nr:hypothetical protein [Gammaproteobacteria bacterium]